MYQERTMRTGIRVLLLGLFAAAVLLLAACGGDDSEAEVKSREATPAPAAALGQASASESTPAPSGGGQARATQAPANATRTLQVSCGDDLKAFRFSGRLLLQTSGTGGNSADPISAAASLLGDVKFSGAVVAPDRASFKFEGGKDSLFGGQAIEFIQIGDTSYTKIGGTGWQSATGSGALDLTEGLDPREMCKTIQDSLRADVPSRKEKVNGVDAIRYDYDRNTLEKLEDAGGFFGDIIGGDLPENFKMNVWVSEKEKFPVKMTMFGSGIAQGEKYSMELELNVTDLNGNVKIDAPR
jgi:hypothetical protein